MKKQENKKESQGFFCLGCARSITKDVVEIPTTRNTIVYSHDNEQCLESAIRVAEAGKREQ